MTLNGGSCLLKMMKLFPSWVVISCTGRSKVHGLPGFCLPHLLDGSHLLDGMLDEIAGK